MTMVPLTLGVLRRSGTGTAVPVSKSKAQADKALQRDDYTCRCCGFRAQRFQRVLPAEEIAEAKDSFITLCRFCELCFTLDQTGLSGAGVLVWLPEMSQADLNHIMRAIYVARDAGEGPVAQAATRAFDALMARRAEAKKRLGQDDPLLLATVLLESMSDADYANRAAKLEGIRLFPLDRWVVRGRNGDINQFERMVRYWRSPEGPFSKVPVESWGAMFEKMSSSA